MFDHKLVTTHHLLISEVKNQGIIHSDNEAARMKDVYSF